MSWIFHEKTLGSKESEPLSFCEDYFDAFVRLFRAWSMLGLPRAAMVSRSVRRAGCC